MGNATSPTSLHFAGANWSEERGQLSEMLVGSWYHRNASKSVTSMKYRSNFTENL